MKKLLRIVSVIAVAAGFVAGPAFALDADDPFARGESRTLTGVLVSRGPDAVVVKSQDGISHRIRVDERTRYVWGERSELRDFAPGATVRADFEAKPEPLATAVWILSPPRR